MKGLFLKNNPNYMKQWFDKKPGYASNINKQWYKENKDKHMIIINSFKQANPNYMNKWHQKNPGYKQNYSKNWYENNKEYVQEYSQNNLDKSRIRDKENYNKNLSYKLAKIIRARIFDSLNRGHKSARTMELLGCSILEFKNHIETQFVNGMSWSNYGKDWEIDHIKPCYSFNLINPEEQKQCFNWSNQRPLWKTTQIASIYGHNDVIGNRNREKNMIGVKQW